METIKRFQVLDFKFYTALFLLKNIENFQCMCFSLTTMETILAISNPGTSFFFLQDDSFDR